MFQDTVVILKSFIWKKIWLRHKENNFFCCITINNAEGHYQPFFYFFAFLPFLRIGLLLDRWTLIIVKCQEIVFLLRSCQTACQNTFHLLQTFTSVRIICADCPRISATWACWLSSISARNHGSLSFSSRFNFKALLFYSVSDIKYLSEKYQWLPCFRINCWSFLILSQIWRA